MPNREFTVDKGAAPAVAVAGVTPQEQRDDEDLPIERAQKAHQRYQDAIWGVLLSAGMKIS
jgi:hypothetical protein